VRRVELKAVVPHQQAGGDKNAKHAKHVKEQHGHGANAAPQLVADAIARLPKVGHEVKVVRIDATGRAARMAVNREVRWIETNKNKNTKK
jgi:hypothetical protein